VLTIYHARRTRSIRVVWLLEEMGVPYEVRTATLRDLSPELLALNPAGTLPVLVDGGVVLCESVTMLDYVAETYGPTPLALAPDAPNYWDYRQLMMFGEATLAAPINGVVANVFMAPDDQKDDFTCGVIRDSMKKRLGVVSQGSRARPMWPARPSPWPTSRSTTPSAWRLHSHSLAWPR
jgi:glutathione S-transferase